MIDTRAANLAGALVCAGMMAYALYAQYVLMLMPCPLCVFQRVAVVFLGVVFLAAAIHNPGPRGRQAYAALLLVCGVAGIGVAGRHVYLQSLPPEELPSCGPGLGFLMDTLPMGDVFSVVLKGSGECGSVDWTFVGLSMPGWVLLGVLALTAAGLYFNLRPSPQSV
jgi:disulfide bond formation protein DsbB